jgi:FkbM family methyltransferase
MLKILEKCYKPVKQVFQKLYTKHLITFKCNYKWFGNDYGGFYICPDILNNKDEIIVYSAGIGQDISFDMDMMNEYTNCTVFAYDPTPKSIEWIKKQHLPKRFKFFPYGLSNKTGEEQMYMPQNKNHVSGSVQKSSAHSSNYVIVEMKTIEDIIKENNHNYIDIIKMDIEGSEFSVIENLDFKNIKCGQIVVEFHNRFFKNGKKLFNNIVNILKENNFYCFAISNNGDEFSFINKDIYGKIL